VVADPEHLVELGRPVLRAEAEAKAVGQPFGKVGDDVDQDVAVNPVRLPTRPTISHSCSAAGALLEDLEHKALLHLHPGCGEQGPDRARRAALRRSPCEILVVHAQLENRRLLPSTS